MNWFKSFWKKLTAPSAATAPTLRQIFGGSEPASAGPGTPPFDKSFSNFTPRAQQVLALARKEADRLNHNFLGTEHLLLGLIKLGQGVSVNVLAEMGVNLETVRAEVEKQVGTGPDQKMIGNIPFTPRTKKVLDLARREAKNLNHTYIGTEHILLGLLREGDGIAARILKSLGLNLEKTRQEILKELDIKIKPAVGEQTARSQLQTPSSELPTGLPPQGEPVDTSKRYDVHCTDRSQGVTVYRNVRFKGVKHLFPRSQYDTLSVFVELEQENGQIVFVSRSSIIRFTEAGEAGKQE
jgi:Clp amino terminal domain, pathogenicity island component